MVILKHMRLINERCLNNNNKGKWSSVDGKGGQKANFFLIDNISKKGQRQPNNVIDYITWIVIIQQEQSDIMIEHPSWRAQGQHSQKNPWKALEPLRALKALQAGRLWECGGRESAKTAGWLSSDWEAGLELQRTLAGRSSGLPSPYNSDQALPHQDRSFGSTEHLSFKGWPFYDIIWLDELMSPNYRQGHHWLGH